MTEAAKRPGGNVTGTTFFTVGLEPKWLELLHELVPNASVIAVLVNPNFPEVETQLKDLSAAARAVGLQVVILRASSESGILRGAKPADLPVQAPTKYETVVNLKTARALGFDVPPTLLTHIYCPAVRWRARFRKFRLRNKTIHPQPPLVPILKNRSGPAKGLPEAPCLAPER